MQFYREGHSVSELEILRLILNGLSINLEYIRAQFGCYQIPGCKADSRSIVEAQLGLEPALLCKFGRYR